MRKRDYLFSIILLAAVAWASVSCKKKVEPEAFIPRAYDLPDMDEEELDDLPEAGEDDTAKEGEE
ncbi:MAG: hypothetical protein ABGX31_02305 [bacterium]|jgi:hypothetical protein